jgi:hypothetical protein
LFHSIKVVAELVLFGYEFGLICVQLFLASKWGK